MMWGKPEIRCKWRRRKGDMSEMEARYMSTEKVTLESEDSQIVTLQILQVEGEYKCEKPKLRGTYIGSNIVVQQAKQSIRPSQHLKGNKILEIVIS